VRRLRAPIPLSRLRLGWAFELQLTKALANGGVPLLAGTDGPPIPGVGSGCALHQELQLLVLAGLTPYQALRTATGLPGEFFAREFHWPQSGTITVGARGDLVLLGANPLVDIRNTMSVEGVILNGTWISAHRLREITRSLGAGLQ
jgi:imidazolonepropionase-like amidohydrolase